jgi:xanthosine utilization system XapX-like protein
MSGAITYIILGRAISKFGCENVIQRPTPPSLLAVGVVGMVVGLDSSETALKVIAISIVDRF